MTTQGRRRKPDLPEGTPQRDPSGRTDGRGDGWDDDLAGGWEPREPRDVGRDAGRDSGREPLRESGRGGKQQRPTLEPMQINEAKVIWIGIAVWAAAFAVLLPFRKDLIADGHGWWLYTCLAGAGLGMMGLPLVKRRKQVIEQEIEHGQGRSPRAPRRR